MAVEAQYIHLLSPQFYKNRESAMNTIDNAQASLMYSNVQNPTLPMSTNENLSQKRPISSVLINQDVSSQICNHMLDIDRLIVQHVVNARTELSQKRRKFSNQIIAAISESVSNQMKAKDEEIDQLKRLNYAMEERIKNLDMENNAWKYLAQSHEAAAAALSANLEQVLAQKELANNESESCCGDNYSTNVGESCNFGKRRQCRNCGNGEPSVLLLPCRHLCLCAACGPAINVCPICNSCKTGSVNVNLS